MRADAPATLPPVLHIHDADARIRGAQPLQRALFVVAHAETRRRLASLAGALLGEEVGEGVDCEDGGREVVKKLRGARSVDVGWEEAEEGLIGVVDSEEGSLWFDEREEEVRGSGGRRGEERVQCIEDEEVRR